MFQQFLGCQGHQLGPEALEIQKDLVDQPIPLGRQDLLVLQDQCRQMVQNHLLVLVAQQDPKSQVTQELQNLLLVPVFLSVLDLLWGQQVQ